MSAKVEILELAQHRLDARRGRGDTRSMGEAARERRGSRSKGPAWEDGYKTLLDPDLPWRIRYAHHGHFPFHGGRRLRVTFVVCEEGKHLGNPVNLFLKLPKPGKDAARSSRLYRLYQQATGLVPPRNVAKRSPNEFLADAEFEARVRTIDRDSDGVEVPKEGRYSVLDYIQKRVAGCPPVLQKRRGLS